MPRNIQIADHEISYKVSRSGGPGGQNVNKTNSKVTLYWMPHASPLIPDAVKVRFLEKYSNNINDLGQLVIHSDETRDRLQNQERCLKKLQDMLKNVWEEPKARKATKPSRSSQQRRMTNKKQRGEVKAGRMKVKDY